MTQSAPHQHATDDGCHHLVTGGASGLGRAVVQLLLERGDHVTVLDRTPPDEAVDYVSADLSDPRAAEAALIAALGAEPLHGLICAAGTDACGRFEDVPAPIWERVVAVNLFGVAAAARAVLPALRAGNGRIVNVASTLGLKAVSDATAYCASKSAVIAFGRALAMEIQPDVGLTTLVPGGMATAFFDERPEQYRPGDDAHLNDPRNVARAVLFALDQPRGCELRELVICPVDEPSWP